MSDGIELRAYTFLDSMQPAFASFVATTSRGYLPVEGQAALFVEISPGIAINRVTDVALKGNDVKPGLQVVERAFGLLEIHSDSQAEVLSAGARILDHLGLGEQDRLRPLVKSSEIITNIDPYQAQLINRIRYGDMLLGGETLYILEVHPAAYATIAANEAEKASPVKLIQMQPFGAFGRLYLGGTEAAIREAVGALTAALACLSGRDNT
jgi:ethanolamine utilization microcompartment shell protein EutS